MGETIFNAYSLSVRLAYNTMYESIKGELICLLIAAGMQPSNYTVYHRVNHRGNWYSSYSLC